MARTKKQDRPKEPIKIRFKALANGNKSIYLDIYRNGARSYEFLKLYLIPEKDAAARTQNTNTLTAANAIKAKRILDITNDVAGIKASNKKMLLCDLLKLYREDMIKRGAVGGAGNIQAPLQAIIAYKGDKITLQQVTKDYCLGFIDYLRNTATTKSGKKITAHTALSYYGVLSAALNAAVRNELIPENPFKKISAVDKIKAGESQRAHLTLDELKQLRETECPRDDVKRTYLFSCYCGLRLGDIRKLTWGKLTKDGKQWRVEIVMQKTSAPLYLPLSKSAMECLPTRGKAGNNDLVFGKLPTTTTYESILKKWTEAAKIDKHITFHTARHTFATLMLTLGTDIFTTSKLLGHSKVQTTTIYAKIVNKKKDEAVNLIDEALN